MVKPSTEGSFQNAVHVDATLPKLKERKPVRSEQLTFREPGSPAGSFPHTPWWHCKRLNPARFVSMLQQPDVKCDTCCVCQRAAALEDTLSVLTDATLGQLCRLLL